ncbi:MAG: hypothetical protein FJ245_14135 [Nitrospira sp.]|nr:hypothetical protein [Nitrospira sp.]
MRWQTQAPVTNGTPPKAVLDWTPFRAWMPFLLACLLINLPALAPALAVTMTEDPKGFEGIPWGAGLSESSNFTVVYADDRVKEYRLQQEPLLLGTVPVQSMKFSTLDGKFARVTVRYQGDQRHETMLLYLQSRYGPLDLTPGQTMAGTNQQYNWRGTDTEVNLTYDGKRETGVIYFESAALGAKLAEVISGF